jgi:hypothetical protein
MVDLAMRFCSILLCLFLFSPAAQADPAMIQSAEAGDVASMSTLATKYLNGDGLRKDVRQAAFWAQKAADAGDATAMANLAWLYESGQGVKENATLAAQYYLDAATAGNPQILKVLYGRKYDVRLELQRLLKREGAYTGRLNGRGSEELEAAIRIYAGRGLAPEPPSLLTPNDKDIRDALRTETARRMAALDVVAGECGNAGSNPLSSVWCLGTGFGQMNSSTFQIDIRRVALDACVRADTGVAYCKYQVITRTSGAGDLNIVAQIMNSHSGGTVYGSYARIDEVWTFQKEFQHCSWTESQINCVPMP